ncbi:MAG: amino acid adenylation domain-containing protein [Cyanobacteria bacterium P01_F01_bin.143]
MIATEVNRKKNDSYNSFSNKIYWINKLAGELSASKIEADYLNLLDSSRKDSSLKFKLPIFISRKIIKFTQQSNFSIYILLLACWKILLQKYTNNNDLIVGSPSYRQFEDNRQENRLQIIPICSTIELNRTFKSFLLETKNTLIEAYLHQDCSFDEISSLLKSEKNCDLYSLFDTIFILENIHKQDISEFENSLIVSCLRNDDTISGEIRYNQQIFQDKSIEFIIQTYLNIIESVINNVNIIISEITFINNESQQLLLQGFNNNNQRYPLNKTIDSLFEEQVQQTPDRIAAVNQKSCLTYQQLNEQANQLAKLLKNSGLAIGEFVGILKDRDLNFLIGILAVFKAGGVYVPIDSTYPQTRIQYMLSNSEVKFVLTDSSSLKNNQKLLSSCPHLQSIICLDISDDRLSSEAAANLKVYDRRDYDKLATVNLKGNLTGVAPAYVLYTSGSTGLPKGAIVRHDGAINHIYAQFTELELDQEFTFLQSAPSSTDISVWQFLAPLLIGGRTIIVDMETVAFAERLFNVLKSEKVTVIELVPALFNALLEHVLRLPIAERELPDLKWMMLSGESTSIKQINKWLSIYPRIKIANAYGPTEAADDITQFIIDKPVPENQRTIPIGKPLANLNLYVLDQEMQLLPIGAPGEICVSGIGVGNGYWKNEAKTKLAFVPNPFTRKLLSPENHDLIYKTGDLGRWLSDGNIEFLGRIDHQVKIRGFRIELGEIEAFLNQHSKVKENVVVVHQAETDDKKIIAYVVARTESAPSVKELRTFLKEKLPDHMIPAAFIMITNIPLAPSGKVDRKALPEPNISRTETEFVLPRNATEKTIVDIYGEILKQDKISINDNFFEIGGHSLIATRVISQIRQIFKVELPLRTLFEHPTIVALAQEIQKSSEIDLALKVLPIKRITGTKEFPLSFAQQRLWFLSQLEPNNSSYNIFAAVRLRGELNLNALEKSFNEIVRRHEALRTNFQTREGQAVAIIAQEKPLRLSIQDISSLPALERESKITNLLAEQIKQPFNLAEDCLLRLKLFRLQEQEHIVLFTIHHIVSDYWSTDVLIEELAALYRAFSENKPSPLPELTIQYQDFAVWQRQWLQKEILQHQLDYWKQQLGSTFPPRLALPKQNSSPGEKANQGANQSFTLSKDLSTAINLLSRRSEVTLFMTLLAIFQVLLHYFAGTEDIRVGSPVANRKQVEIEKLIGFFVNTLVLRIDLSGNPSFRELLARARQVTLEAYAHQDLPFEKLVEELQPERMLNQHPLYQAWFVLHNTPMSQLELTGLVLTQFELESEAVRHDLQLSIAENAEVLDCQFEYKTDLFSETSISRLIENFQTLAQHVVDQPDTKLKEITTMLAQSDRQQQTIQKQELRAAGGRKLKMIKRKTIRE